MNSNLGNGSFWVEIGDAEHVDRCSWNIREFDRINWPLTSAKFTFLDMLTRLAIIVSESSSVPTFVFGGLRGSTATSAFVCVIVVTMRGWSDVGLWVALCFLAKVSVRIYNHVCTIDTVTGNLAVNSVFITFRSMKETKKFHFFSFFETLFTQKYRFLYHGDQKISW